jgi:hypothetical protein
MLYPFKKNNLYGLINANGREITPAIYQYVDHFSEGLIGVHELKTFRLYFVRKKTRSVFSYIDALGQTIIQDLNIISGAPFSEDLAYVRFKKEDKYGFINKEGQIVIPPTIESQFCLGFSGGLAGLEINEKFGFINKSMEEVIPFKYDWVNPFQDGYSIVKTRSKKSFIDKEGNKLKTDKCLIDDSIYGGFKEKLAVVSVANKSGIINTDGYIVIDPVYDLLGGFNEGLCPARKDNVYGYLNANGDYAIEPKFANALGFRNGVAPATIDQKKWGLINTKGEFIKAPSFDFISPFENESYTNSRANTWLLTIAEQGRTKYYINTQGETVLEYESQADKERIRDEMLAKAFNKESEQKTVWDKAKWAYDGIEITKKGAIKPFYEILKWLKTKDLLTEEGLDVYRDKNNLGIGLYRGMVKNQAADFLDRYYDLWFETESIADFQMDPDMKFENSENLDLYWDFYLKKTKNS